MGYGEGEGCERLSRPAIRAGPVPLSGELALVGTEAVSSGVIISTYRPNGPLRTASFDDAAA
jgi:hypothetical protein